MQAVSSGERSGTLWIWACKGQVLNELSLYWFEASRGIIRNHILEKLSPRSVLTLKCDVLPVEVVVRGYLTGSAWRDYRQGKAISGIVLPPHMRMNQKFDRPLITPTTKAERGTHDLPISSAGCSGWARRRRRIAGSCWWIPSMNSASVTANCW